MSSAAFAKSVDKLLSKSPEMSEYEAGRAVFRDWIAKENWDQLIKFVDEEFEPGAGDWELLELSHHLLETESHEQFDRLWMNEIARRSEILSDRRRADQEKLRSEIEQQFQGPLSAYHGTLDVHFRRYHDERAAEDSLAWALSQYDRLMMRDRFFMDVLDDEELKQRRDGLHKAAEILLR